MVTMNSPLWSSIQSRSIGKGPLLRAVLPHGMVGPRQGRCVSFNPFYVNGPAYGGLIGGADEAALYPPGTQW